MNVLNFLAHKNAQAIYCFNIHRDKGYWSIN